MTAKRGSVLLVSSLFSVVSAMAQGQVGTTPTPLPRDIILYMFAGGIGAISITWVLVPWIFASRDKLDDLVDLLRHGAVMRFVTVTYIVIVAVTLAIVDRLDGDKVATLLASIAGYVLGQATSSKREERDERPEPRRTIERQPSSTLVRPDERPRPTQPVEGIGS
jgi:hypothetical protein